MTFPDELYAELERARLLLERTRRIAEEALACVHEAVVDGWDSGSAAELLMRLDAELAAPLGLDDEEEV